MMKNITKSALISASVGLLLSACQSGADVSGQYLCMNPGDQKIIEELTLRFGADHHVVVSVAYKDQETGQQNAAIPAIPSKDYKYTVEDKKVVILGVNYGMLGTTSAETFVMQGNQLAHSNGQFFGGHQCKKV
jgi:protein-disulfide isomerase